MSPEARQHPFAIDYLFLILYVPLKCQPAKFCRLLLPFTDTLGQRPDLLPRERQVVYYTDHFVTEVIKDREKNVR